MTGLRVLELGAYVAPAYAGMVLAEQGHRVMKWCSPTTPDPVLGLRHGQRLWAWLNDAKTVRHVHARLVADLPAGSVDVVVDNLRASTWAAWRVDPAEQAHRLAVPWVALRDDLDGRSFDAVAQARAWGDHIGYLPAYLGDTSAGLWMAFKAASTAVAGTVGLHVLRQATCLAKLVEGELLLDDVPRRGGACPPWDEPGTYGLAPDGAGVQVIYRGDTIREPFRGPAWRHANLHHRGGRLTI
jgi:hypothetical protein